MARVALAVLNAQAELVRTALNNGYLRLYTAPRPTEPENSVGAAVLIAELRISAVSSPVPTTGELTISVAEELSTRAAGVLGWARSWATDGVTSVADYTVGLAGSGADILVSPTLSVAAGKRFAVSSFIHRMVRGT